MKIYVEVQYAGKEFSFFKRDIGKEGGRNL